MYNTISYLASGCLFGLVAGLSPGPLFALVVSETFRGGRRAGVLVAVAPLVTDLPVVAASLYILAGLAGADTVLGALSLFGAAFIAYMAYGNFTAGGAVRYEATAGSRPLARGALVNALSPHPYLFWMSVGGPIVVNAYSSGYGQPAAFISGFYVLLVGTKVAVALLVARTKAFLSERAYIYILRLLGAALIAFAVMFARDGLRLLGLT